MIDVISNVEVLTYEIGLDNHIHNVPTYFEPKEVDYIINFYKDVSENVNEDVNEGEFVSEDVNDNEVINDDFEDDIFVVRKFQKIGNIISLNIAGHCLKKTL